MRLTETGEHTSEPETGTVQAAGSAAHDKALARVEAAFTRAGYLVAPVRQDGSGQPDAWAVHPDCEVPLALEIETTTHTKPAKVLRNLARAHKHGVLPVFVVPPSDGEHAGAKTAIAERVSNILNDPVKERENSEVEFYIGTKHITFNGGAEADNGVTAVRPVTSGGNPQSNRTRWRRKAGHYILTDEAGTEHARVKDIDRAPKEQFPATFSIDAESRMVTVTVPGELPRSYESEAAFREDWVPIKRPLIPDIDLPEPEYGPETYVIVVLRDGDQDTEGLDGDVVIYEDEQLYPLERLQVAAKTSEVQPPGSSSVESVDPGEPTVVSADGGMSEQFPTYDNVDDDSEPTEETDSTSLGDVEAGVESFAAELLIDEENVIPFRTVYEIYEAFAEENGFKPKSATHFTPTLKQYIPVESKSKWFDGETQQCYVGIALVETGVSGGDADE